MHSHSHPLLNLWNVRAPLSWIIASSNAATQCRMHVHVLLSPADRVHDPTGRSSFLDSLHAQTTIMAASFKGGVVLGADTRTSTGAYVANRVTNKLTQLAEKVRDSVGRPARVLPDPAPDAFTCWIVTLRLLRQARVAFVPHV